MARRRALIQSPTMIMRKLKTFLDEGDARQKSDNDVVYFFRNEARYIQKLINDDMDSRKQASADLREMRKMYAESERNLIAARDELSNIRYRYQILERQLNKKDRRGS